MADEFKFDQTLDCRGLSCPMPILKTKKRLEKMESGQVLEMLSSDPGTKNDIASFAKRGGHEYLGMKEDEGFNRFYIKKA